MAAHGILLDVVSTRFEVGAVEDEVVSEASLPDRRLRGEAMREAAFDQVHDLRDGLSVRCEQQMNVVGHDDEGMEPVCALGAIVLEGFEEEFGVRGNLEESSAIW